MHISYSLASVHRNKGKSYIELRNYKEAQRSFEQAIEAYKQATEAYEQAIEEHKEPSKFLQRAPIIACHQQMVRAIQQECADTYTSYGDALDNSPKKALQAYYVAIQLYNGLIQHGVKDHEKEEFEKLLALVYVKRGYVQLRLKRYKQVLEECDKALHYNNSLHIAKSLKSDALEMLGLDDEAS